MAIANIAKIAGIAKIEDQTLPRMNTDDTDQKRLPSSRVIGKAKSSADQGGIFTAEARREQELGFNFDLALCRFCFPSCSFVSFVVKGFCFSIWQLRRFWQFWQSLPVSSRQQVH
jgi:hypothetical protein